MSGLVAISGVSQPFETVPAGALTERVFELIGKEWMLLTAGHLGDWNTMTASWGALGELWSRPAAFTFIRPTRYTFEFAEREPLFTLSFFGDRFREALQLCGTRSGRDCDKAAETGLTPFEVAPGAVAFREARLILVCRKLYFQDIDPARFLDEAIAANYPYKDYHRMYVGEVLQVLRARDGVQQGSV